MKSKLFLITIFLSIFSVVSAQRIIENNRLIERNKQTQNQTQTYKYYTEGSVYYDESNYDLAIKKFLRIYNPFSDSWDKTEINIAWKLAMCYAKIGESLFSFENGIYDDYRRRWRSDAARYVRECEEHDKEGIYDKTFVYEIIGKSLYYKGKSFYDNGFYKHAAKYADSASKQFVDVGLTEWVNKSIDLSVKANQKIRLTKSSLEFIPPEGYWDFRVLGSPFVDYLYKNIPKTGRTNSRTLVFCLHNTGSYGTIDDETLFMRYFHWTLGIPEQNIFCFRLQSKHQIDSCINTIKQKVNTFGIKPTVIIYYSGLTCYDDQRKEDMMLFGYDGYKKDNKKTVPIKYLYDELNKIQSDKTICFMNFRQSEEESGEVAFSVKIKTDADESDEFEKKPGTIRIKNKVTQPGNVERNNYSNMIIFKSCDITWKDVFVGESLQYLFPEFMFNKIREKKGDVSLGELLDFVSYNVRLTTFDLTDEFQKPSVSVSGNLMSTWRDIKL